MANIVKASKHLVDPRLPQGLSPERSSTIACKFMLFPGVVVFLNATGRILHVYQPYQSSLGNSPVMVLCGASFMFSILYFTQTPGTCDARVLLAIFREITWAYRNIEARKRPNPQVKLVWFDLE